MVVVEAVLSTVDGGIDGVHSPISSDGIVNESEADCW